jgi:hypothetical protein
VHRANRQIVAAQSRAVHRYKRRALPAGASFLPRAAYQWSLSAKNISRRALVRSLGVDETVPLRSRGYILGQRQRP